MARAMGRLSVKGVANKTVPGYYADGGNLNLQVSESGSKSWVFRYTLQGRQREMGIGSLTSVSLGEARKRAASCRLLLEDGVDPIAARNARRAQDALSSANTVSFKVCADSYIASHRPGWKNQKHADQWESTIKAYCSSVIGTLPVQAVATSHVMQILEPIWTKIPETANRLRGRIESILDWASARGYRSGENPARWRGHLAELLPAMKKTARVKHHPALPYEEIGAFISELKLEEGIAARALEFLILTAARTSEAINATPAEFDLDKAIWTIPAGRMKSGKEHRVPLSPRAMEIIRTQLELNENYVFPGQKSSKPLSNMAMLKLLERMGRKDLTVHGFRSSFRDWGAEQTSYPSEVLEMALAHTVGDKVEAAYRRGDLFEKRRELAIDWAKYCAQKKAGKVTPIRKQK